MDRNSDELARVKRVLLEALLIRQHYPSFCVRTQGKRLVCRARLKPSDHSAVYRVEFTYEAWNPPRIRILESKIEFNADIHMYRDETLCLYDWRQQPWEFKSHLYDTVIPWTAEWLLFYELYVLTGKWLGKSAAHSTPLCDRGPREDTAINKTTEMGPL